MESDPKNLKPLDVPNIDPIPGAEPTKVNKPKYSTIQEYLDKLLYPTLKIAKTEKFHDRFIIIDNKELYHCGASIKDLGKKCFGINRVENEEFIELIKNIGAIQSREVVIIWKMK